MKKLGIPLRIISGINTVANLSGWSVVQMILAQFGYAKFVNWIFWFSVIL